MGTRSLIYISVCMGELYIVMEHFRIIFFLHFLIWLAMDRWMDQNIKTSRDKHRERSIKLAWSAWLSLTIKSPAQLRRAHQSQAPLAESVGNGNKTNEWVIKRIQASPLLNDWLIDWMDEYTRAPMANFLVVRELHVCIDARARWTLLYKALSWNKRSAVSGTQAWARMCSHVRNILQRRHTKRVHGSHL